MRKSLLLVILLAALCPAWQTGVAQPDQIAFDNAKAEVKNLNNSWKVVAGDLWLMDFGPHEDQARMALQVIKHYGINQQCFTGRPTRTMEYYLADGKPPTGAFEGEDAIPFNPANLEARQINGRWKIVEGDSWIMDFGDKEADAREALEVIRKFGFDHICFIGRPKPGMTYFRTSDGKAPAAAPEAAGKAQLKVTVIEGEKGPARRPAITVRSVDRPGDNPVSLMENPSLFDLKAGSYDVTAHVGIGAETPPQRVQVQDGRVTELTVNTGTGTLELTLNAGGKPLPRGPNIELRAAGALVSAVSESPAKFQAPAGSYTVRVNLINGQTFDIPDMAIAAGQTTQRTIEVPCAQVTVKVSGGPYAPGSGKYPFVEIQKEGRMVTALADNPARFFLLAGDYTAGIREGGEMLGAKTFTVQGGQDQVVEINR